MKRKMLTILIGGILVLSMLTGCTELKEDEKIEDEITEKSKGNCEAEECITLINPEMSLEEINEVIGFEGDQKDDTATYVWQLTEKTKIEVEFKDNLGTITATMDKDKIADNNIKASKFYSIQNDLKDGTTYTYEEMVNEFDGIDGYLATYAPTFKRYIWVKDGQTFGATFSDSIDGKCSIVSLR